MSTRGDQPDDSLQFAMLTRGLPPAGDQGIASIEALRARWQYALPCLDGGRLIVQMLAFELEQFSLEAFGICNIACPDTIARSVRKRQAEYFFGRLAARQALQHQGLIAAGTCPDIATGSSREPLWPAQVIGSISHTNRLAAAAVAPLGRWRGIGIDLEHVVGADAREALLSTVVDSSELALLQSICASTNVPLEVLLTIVFSAKESLFKASFSAVGRYFDFSCAHLVALDRVAGRVRFQLSEQLCQDLPSGHLCDTGFGFVDPQTVITYRIW
ncbi:4'-phosphopantetheinyl transferase superfamily protein [Xanthomonas sp. 3058]|uniref:4'-phosphopantetheinyl transferase family protein n=1 Tax=Xanthomonas sp. 3058 TaxID=3035314 RepID=UPI0018395D3A|nr:4'-phosphopantetheinyl transferase superfamily protein [Xanthomonas sp. 3058]MBB5863285.1 4'-phosphopantetheinyl transferase EntD [Xanthomonas sp. 3058]